MRRRSRYRDRTPPELNITAFMNLMVVLVPFLLITAVFSRITILQLNLPQGAGAANDPPKKELQLEVVIRDDALVVQDRESGPLQTIRNTPDGYDVKALSEFLKQVKARFPEKVDATILSEPGISYEVLVQVMDAVRMTKLVQAGSVVRAELFPEISIGDAPPVNGTGQATNKEHKS
jgi:biopolymer transport protein ExbD